MRFSTQQLLGLLSLSATASAGAVLKRAVDAATLSKLMLYGQYTAATYCPKSTDGTLAALECRGAVPDNCPLVEAANVPTVYEFNAVGNQLTGPSTGYIAVDNSVNQNIVVAYRGSDSFTDFIVDIAAFGKTSYEDLCQSACPGAMGSASFKNSYLNSQPGVFAKLDTLVAAPANAGKTIIVTGHSLGGALAQVAVAAIRKRYPTRQVTFASFGAPEVGNEQFVQNVMAQDNVRGRNFRVTHKGDPVPDSIRFTQGRTVSTYRQVSPDYFINTPNGVTVTAANIELHTGTNERDTTIPDNTLGRIMDLGNHSFYFNAISNCTANV